MSRDIERLEKLYELEPTPRLARQLAAAYTHAGRPRRARTHLLDALADPEAFQDAARLGVDRWSTHRGALPYKTALGSPPTHPPRTLWRFHSPLVDERFGLPPALRPDRILLLAQSTVVGMRFVRMLAIDTATGRIAWENERRNLLALAAPFWLGGDTAEEQAGWAFATLVDGDITLGIASYHAENGTPSHTAWHPLPEAIAIAASSSLAPLDANTLGWPVHWTSEEAHHRITLHVDRESGTFRHTHSPWAAPESIVPCLGRAFGIDDRGILDLGSGERTLPFDDPDPDAHIEGPRHQRTMLATRDGLFFYRPTYHELTEGGRVLVRRNVPTFLHPQTGHTTDFDHRERFLCATPTGEVYAARTPRTLVRLDPEAGCQVIDTLDVDTLHEACWSGGLLMIRASVNGEQDVRAIDPKSGNTLWVCELDEGGWHQGPIPTPVGFAGMFSDGCTWLKSHSKTDT